jgi:PhzF family phenazine biosynthesis protein
MSVSVLHYDAFSKLPGKGNPAGVVMDLVQDEVTMQEVARLVGFNETVFIGKVERGVVELRYFTPGHEVDLCGHATMAAFAALRDKRSLPTGPYTLRCRAGELPIQLTVDSSSNPLIWMNQPSARFVTYTGDVAAIADAIGLESSDLVPDLPMVYGYTGLWTLIIPVCGLEAMALMKPRTAEFPKVLEQMPRVSVHPFCLETVDPSCQMQGRHFSSPYSGTIEDPVTGTASGVMGAYYAKYIHPGHRDYSLTIEQGKEVNRDGRVSVEVKVVDNDYQVRIGGTAVMVEEMRVGLSE